MTYSERAKKIITDILYLTLGTVSKSGKPWVSPVYTAFDKDYTFFWVSAKTSRHSRNIRANSSAAMVIYDSTVPEGTGFGVYIEAEAHQLTHPDDVAYGLSYIFGRIGHTPPLPEDCLGTSPLRVYKGVPKKFWVNIDERYQGQYVDKREEITLK